MSSDDPPVRVPRHNFRVRIPKEVAQILKQEIGPSATEHGWTVQELIERIATELENAYNCEEEPANLPSQKKPHPAFGRIDCQTLFGVQIGYCVNRNVEIITIVGARGQP